MITKLLTPTSLFDEEEGEDYEGEEEKVEKTATGKKGPLI